MSVNHPVKYPFYRFRSVAIVMLIFVMCTSTNAQVRPEASIGLLLGFPQGEFRDHVPNLGIGISGMAGIRIPNSPVFIGGDLGFLIYGHEQRREMFSWDHTAQKLWDSIQHVLDSNA